jgi:hypothetical protein
MHPTNGQNGIRPESKDKREQDNAPYLKPTSEKQPETLGGVRF